MVRSTSTQPAGTTTACETALDAPPPRRACVQAAACRRYPQVGRLLEVAYLLTYILTHLLLTYLLTYLHTYLLN